jgi:hypothetical protein
MSERRGLSSVADVSLALVVLVAGVGVFVAHLETTETDHDPTGAAETAETLGSSTLNLTYSLEPVLETDSELVAAPGDADASYDSEALERSTHGSTMGHVARAALADTRFAPGGDVRPFAVGERYEEMLDERLLVSLVGASFATNVTAVWEPYEGASVRGTAAFGQPIPHETQRSVTRTTVASELPAVRTEALAAVGDETSTDNGYVVVAEIVASAIVRGILGDTQRELESDGVERAVVVSRYLRFADAVGVNREELNEHLGRSSADDEAMLTTLVDRLTATLTAELTSEFGTARAAADAVSTGRVTVSVTRWSQ